MQLGETGASCHSFYLVIFRENGYKILKHYIR